jgi:hypothetical protein
MNEIQNQSIQQPAETIRQIGRDQLRVWKPQPSQQPAPAIPIRPDDDDDADLRDRR